MGNMFNLPTSTTQEAAQNAAIAPPYASVNLIETTAPTTDNFAFCIATQTTYQLVAKGTFTVDHVNILTAVGTSLYVWKAINGLYGPNVPIFTDSDEPDAADMANLLWWNSTSGTYRYSNGTTKIDVSAGANPAQDDGYTIVCPNYMNVANGSTFRMNSTSKQIKIVFPITVDYETFAASLYFSAVGSGGDITATVYAADSSDAVVGEALGTATFASGSSATTWIRHTWTAIQHYRGSRVAVIYSVASGVDVTVYGSRQLPSLDTGLYHNMTCYTTVDGWTTPVAFVQDARPAQFAWILNSTTHNAPQAVYGRHKGDRVSLYENGFWKYYLIPREGIIFNIESGFTVSDPLAGIRNVYNFYLHSTEGVLSLVGSATGRVIQDGQEVMSGATGYRFLGLFFGITRNSQVALACSQKIRSVLNRHGKDLYQLALPYGSTTSKTAVSTSVRKANDNDDFTIAFLSWDGFVRSSLQAVSSNQVSAGFGLDQVAFYRTINVRSYNSTMNILSTQIPIQVSEGLHLLHAIIQTPSTNTTEYYYWGDTPPEQWSLSMYYEG